LGSWALSAGALLLDVASWLLMLVVLAVALLLMVL